MKIEIANTERHPIPAGIFREEENPSHLVVIFGLARTRGDNMIFSTRYTDQFADVLRKYNLSYLPSRELASHQQAKRLAIIQGMNFDSIGVAYNVRQIMNREQYETLIRELCAAIDTDPIPTAPPATPSNTPPVETATVEPPKNQTCSGCGFVTGAEFKFCPTCGTPLK